MKSINLIPTTIENTPELAVFFGILQKVTVGSLMLLIGSGLIVAGTFAYFSAVHTRLLGEKDRIVATINQQSIKEGLLLSAKQRIEVIDKIVAAQKHFTTLFAIVGDLRAVGILTSLTLDDTDTATMTVLVNTIEDAVSLVDALLAHEKSHTLTKPALASFALSKDGGFALSVSFVPKF